MTRHTLSLLGLSACLLTAGCTSIGPASLSSGRDAYVRAIGETDDRQLLRLIVNERYGETTSLLMVSSVTANMKLRGEVSTDIGIGPDANFAGNLVPLGGGVLVEENPTISYEPLRGARYLRDFLTPVPPTYAALLSRMNSQPSFILRILMARLGEHRAGSPEYDEILRILDTLGQEGRLEWITGGMTDGFALRLDSRGEALDAEVDRLHELLQSPDRARGPHKVLQFGIAATDVSEGTIEVATRSLADLIRTAATTLEPPVEHINNQYVRSPEATPGVEQIIRVRSSQSRPSNAYVAVEKYGVWYYLDRSDQRSKAFFRVIAALWDALIADRPGDRQRPVLTIPTN